MFWEIPFIRALQFIERCLSQNVNKHSHPLPIFTLIIGCTVRQIVHRWCAPYAYKEKEGVGCGGADKWHIVPEGAFPGWIPWRAGGGDIWCPDSHYCPTATSMKVGPADIHMPLYNVGQKRSVSFEVPHERTVHSGLALRILYLPLKASKSCMTVTPCT